MKSFALRRTVSICITVLIAIVVIAFDVIGRATLWSTGFLSGWILLGTIAFLASYNVRKQLPFLPLGSSTGWLQLHIYCGLLSFVIFVVHVDYRIPRGAFEGALAILYATVFLSGIVGLYITRTYPRRLTNLGHEVIFEQIPVARRQVRERIEAAVLQCNSEAGTSAIPDFYRDCIRQFIVGQHDILSHLIRGSSRRWRQLMRTIADQDRYLNDNERRVLAEISALIQRKHQLDTQYALQGALKVWLFLHIPATYALIVFAFFHSVLVHAWSGGLP